MASREDSMGQSENTGQQALAFPYSPPDAAVVQL